jgi:threonine dehydrogenase-like Zn-dependent dehydrogenase
MSTLLFERSLPRFAAARIVSNFGSGRGAGIGPLRLVEHDAPSLPGAGWAHVHPLLSGICGSDLATLDGRSSRYFEDIVSFPFVPGHEVVGLLAEEAVGATGELLAAGTRVVLQPVLGCAARGIVPPCAACAAGHVGNCGHLAFGHIRPGLQTGFCADTGGGWSTTGLVAHSSQLYAVPEGLSDADAVTTEPVACAVHAVLGAGITEGDVVAVLGAGTLGLTVTAAFSHLVTTGRCPAPRSLLVGAKYTHQQSLALSFGAAEALPPEQLARAVRRHSHSLSYGGVAGETATLSTGADVVFDCVGSAESIAQSLSMVRPRGTVALVGMPGKMTIDLAPLWHREVRLAGAYAYGTESVPTAKAGSEEADSKEADSKEADSKEADSNEAASKSGAARTRAKTKISATAKDAPAGRGLPSDTGLPLDIGRAGRVSTFALALEVVGAQTTGRLVSATYPLTRFEEAVAHAGAAGRRGSVKIAFDITKGHTR